MVNCHKIAESLFSYETPKIVQIKSILIGVISRLIQLTIIAYIIGYDFFIFQKSYFIFFFSSKSLFIEFHRYVLVYKKGYQEFSEVESSVTTKVKGIIYTNFSDEEFNPEILHPKWYRRIWDVADFVVPPSVSINSISSFVSFSW